MKLNKGLSISIAIFVFISIVFTADALSWSGSTHRILSNHGALNSVLKKDNYLVNYLGFQDGLGEFFKWQDKKQSVIEWMQDGSDLEDAGDLVDYLAGEARSLNHFHNPYVNAWANAGLDDYVMIPNPNPPYIPYQLHVKGKSAPVWAQNGDMQSTFPEGDWSWQRTRNRYYAALTAATDEERQQYFAMTFRGLGHQIHLIQDMAVPEHTRNDAHPEQSVFPYRNEYGELYFEPWAVKAEEKGAFISQRAQNPIFPAVQLDKAIIVDGKTLVPITQFTGTDQYNGTNPSAGTDIGLSEYSNANFFSDDTRFASEIYPINHWHYFPYPKKSSTDLQGFINGEKIPETIVAKDGVVDTGIWISKTGDGEEIAHFVRPSYLTKLIYKLFGEGNLFYRTFYRDEVCHAAYASKLVPRAVGYSAGLLDYFFRGKIDITRPAISSGFITLYAQNTTKSGEEMLGGEIKLVVKYLSSGEVHYAVADTTATTIPRDNPVELVFSNVMPADANDITLQLVYKGKLGQEENAVAVGLKPYQVIIALYKNVGTEQEPKYDWWYYVVDDNKGSHEDPKASFPTNPEIISKWWSCDGMEEAEYYTRVSPAFQNPTSGGAGDNCGLVNFKSAQCCGGSSLSPDTQEDLVVLPCGGEPGYVGWWYGWGGKHVSSCSECGDGQETMWTPGAQSTRSRTSNQSSHCDKGTSWDLSIGQLTENMEIGPRQNTSGYESGSIASATDVHCGPYEKAKMCSPVCSQDGCQYTWMWLPAFCGTVCESNFDCEGWHPVEGGGWTACTNKTFNGTDTYGGQHGSNYQGCALFDIASRSSGYGTMSADVVTKVKVGAVETTFGGNWSSYSTQEGNESVNNVQRGWTTQCLSCPQGSGQGATHKAAHFSFSETSYGVAGWSTVVASDGKFAVLIPKMKLEASATSTDGSASGGISSTTTALLRIVDGAGVDFELATADTGYTLNYMPSSRDDLGIKPNCYPIDLPLDIELSGLHWYSDDAFLVAFMLKDTFYAYLFKKENGAWSKKQLTNFENWVNTNALKDHIMFLK